MARANRLSADLFLSIHHDSVPDSFLETWEYEGHEHGFSDRFKGHSIFFSNENVDPDASLMFGQLLGDQLKARGLQYTAHYIEKFMGHRQRLLVDAKVGVYRYDQLIVLRTTQMPAVLLEAGSIINRAEELVMNSPERQSLIGVAVTDAVDGFCAIRRPRTPDRVASPAGAAAKQTPSPDATAQPANAIGMLALGGILAALLLQARRGRSGGRVQVSRMSSSEAAPARAGAKRSEIDRDRAKATQGQGSRQCRWAAAADASGAQLANECALLHLPAKWAARAPAAPGYRQAG